MLARDYSVILDAGSTNTLQIFNRNQIIMEYSSSPAPNNLITISALYRRSSFFQIEENEK